MNETTYDNIVCVGSSTKYGSKFKLWHMATFTQSPDVHNFVIKSPFVTLPYTDNVY